MTPIKSRSLLRWLLGWLIPACVHGCSCAPFGNNAVEIAENITDADWIDLIVTARFVNETSYEGSGDEYFYDDGITFTFQNTTFIVNEVLFNRDPNGILPSNLFNIQEDGTMELRVKTETTCCVCGQELSPESIGENYLIPLSKDGGLSVCDGVCSLDGPGGEWCSDIASELRALSLGDADDVVASTLTDVSSVAATIEYSSTVNDYTYAEEGSSKSGNASSSSSGKSGKSSGKGSTSSGSWSASSGKSSKSSGSWSEDKESSSSSGKSGKSVGKSSKSSRSWSGSVSKNASHSADSRDDGHGYGNKYRKLRKQSTNQWSSL